MVTIMIKVYKKICAVYCDSKETNLKKSNIIISDENLISTKPRKSTFGNVDLFEKSLIDLFSDVSDISFLFNKIERLKELFSQCDIWIETRYEELDECSGYSINDILNYPNHKVALEFLEQFRNNQQPKKKFNNVFNFNLSDNQLKKYSSWRKTHNCHIRNQYGLRYAGAVGGADTFHITGTWIGYIVEVECSCGSICDLTEDF